MQLNIHIRTIDFPGGLDSKESACNAGDPGSIPGLGRYPGDGNGNPLQCILPGEFHGQRSLGGYIEFMGSQRVGHDWLTLTYAQFYIWMKVKVSQSCPTFCDPMDYNPPGFSVHLILQAGILEWVAIPFSRESFWPKDQTQVLHFRQILYCLSHHLIYTYIFKGPLST